MADCLEHLGGHAEIKKDSILITGHPLHGGTVSGYNDHRIVMSMAIAALAASGPVTIQGVQAVRKSYPEFFEHYIMLGGNCHAVSVE
jgi:3-phosphoshikimate 1-carboxyvinyltransferase